MTVRRIEFRATVTAAGGMSLGIADPVVVVEVHGEVAGIDNAVAEAVEHYARELRDGERFEDLMLAIEAL